MHPVVLRCLARLSIRWYPLVRSTATRTALAAGPRLVQRLQIGEYYTNGRSSAGWSAGSGPDS
jgi:hypothetical protein